MNLEIMDCDFPFSRPLKKGSCTKKDDRISRLPDDVICKILYFVTPTKYAIRTSVLSKRWENLWSLSPKIILEQPRLTSVGIEIDQLRKAEKLHFTTFTNSVDNLLFLRDCLHIEFFKLSFIGFFSSFRMRASSWVCAVVMCNVRELDLCIDSVDSDLLELPWCLFTCKTLVVLKLSGKFILNIPYRVCLPNLKTLFLSQIIYVGDAAIMKLLSGCPVLEDLEIFRHEWDQLWNINFNVSSLKRLTSISYPEVVDYPERVDDEERVCRHKIVVDAPNLEFIKLTDQGPHEIFLKNLPNIVEAHIDIGTAEGGPDDDEVDKMLVLLQSIVNVRRLFLSFSTFYVLCEEIELALPRFCNLVFLELDYTNGPIQLMDLLRSSPNLEALSFPCGLNRPRYFYSDIDYDDGDVDFEFRMNDPESVPECLRHSLKVVQIKNFEGEEIDLNIVMYLLENAMVLQKMTFSFHPDVEIAELQTNLSNHPRLSTDCHLDFIH